MDLLLSQTSGVPFYRQVEEQIADRIRAGQLPPGSPLPSVRQLAAELLVSVITVKKAYEELEHAGLVKSQQGRGTFVAEGGAAMSRELLLAQLRGELDALLGRAAGLGVDAETLQAAIKEAFSKHFSKEPSPPKPSPQERP